MDTVIPPCAHGYPGGCERCDEEQGARDTIPAPPPSMPEFRGYEMIGEGETHG